jgi:hypothetical protein
MKLTGLANVIFNTRYSQFTMMVLHHDSSFEMLSTSTSNV